MKLIIAGSRGIDDYDRVADAVDASGYAPDEVVSGTARGVDTLGERWAREHGVPVRRMPADWDEHGRAAGPIRNREMAAYGDALVAVWDEQSAGTRSMLREAYSRNLEMYLVRPGDDDWRHRPEA